MERDVVCGMQVDPAKAAGTCQYNGNTCYFCSTGGFTVLNRQAAMEVYKSPTCACCSKWVGHLRSHGLQVRVTDTETVDQLKTKHEVPHEARSCHTVAKDSTTRVFAPH